MLTIVRNFFRIKPIRDPRVTTQRAIIGASAVVLSQLADAVSTYVGITFGPAQEANGAMASLIASAGFSGFFLVKIAASALLAWYTWRRPRAPFVVSSIYGAVTVWNLAVSFLVPALLT